MQEIKVAVMALHVWPDIKVFLSGSSTMYAYLVRLVVHLEKDAEDQMIVVMACHVWSIMLILVSNKLADRL